jgi:hypothetical protein
MFSGIASVLGYSWPLKMMRVVMGVSLYSTSECGRPRDD